MHGIVRLRGIAQEEAAATGEQRTVALVHVAHLGCGETAMRQLTQPAPSVVTIYLPASGAGPPSASGATGQGQPAGGGPGGMAAP